MNCRLTLTIKVKDRQRAARWQTIYDAPILSEDRVPVILKSYRGYFSEDKFEYSYTVAPRRQKRFHVEGDK